MGRTSRRQSQAVRGVAARGGANEEGSAAPQGAETMEVDAAGASGAQADRPPWRLFDLNYTSGSDEDD